MLPQYSGTFYPPIAYNAATIEQIFEDIPKLPEI